ncbi:MAG: hypothetical protein EAZ37_06350 [Burkholderiales bacterium]|nr:MAG: hypothetical protein EAZ37_06350 [Burkholderiales bacterium]
MKIRLETIYDYPHTEFVKHLQRTESFRFITWPILSFDPANGSWPERWETGRNLFRCLFLGIAPMGKQHINISYPSQGVEANGLFVLRDDGEGTLMQRWDHWIYAKPHGENQTHYVDEVVVRARYLSPIMTPFSACLLGFFTRTGSGAGENTLHLSKHPPARAKPLYWKALA